MRISIKLIITTILCLIFTVCSIAQTEEINNGKNLEMGLEIQVYPTGIIPGLRLEKYLSPNTSINFRLGYQFIDHRDLGVHNNEEGSGFGGSIAYRKFFNSDYKGLSLALRTDLWFNKIDWEDVGIVGTSNITVIQPVLMGEYAFMINDTFTVTPSLSFGWEWNVATDGEPTGEGAILLIGCSFGFGM